MAQKFLIAAGGNFSSDTAWSTSSGGANNTTHPTVLDDAVIDNLSGQLTVDVSSACLSFTASTYTGTMTWASFTLTVSGSFTYGAGMTISGNNTSTNLQMNASGTLTTAGKTMPTTIGISGGTLILGDNVTMAANHFSVFSLGTSGILDLNGKTLNGNSVVNRILVASGTIGTSRTILNATNTSFTNCDFRDIQFTDASDLDLSAITGKSGDGGGNTLTGGGSVLTFTPAATQTATGTASFTWSTHGWTSRVPLPQDDVVVSNSFIAGRTITLDMPRAGKSLNFSGMSGTPTLSCTTGPSIFGSLTLNSSMVSSGSGFTFMGRGSFNITCAGTTLAGNQAIQAFGGTYTQQDPFLTSGVFSYFFGSWVTQNFNFTSSTFVSSGTGTRSMTLGTSTVTVTATTTGNVINLGTTGLTFSGASATFVIGSVSANTRTFVGGQSIGTLTYTIAGSTGELDITGSNTFGAINFSDASNARSLKFTAGTTTTILTGAGWNVNGTSGKLMTVSSITGATWTIQATSGQLSSDYISIDHSTVPNPYLAFAGTHSTDGGNNVNWVFSAPLTITTGNLVPTFTVAESRLIITDPGITYNQAGVTYNDVRYAYGGATGKSDVVPMSPSALDITPSVI